MRIKILNLWTLSLAGEKRRKIPDNESSVQHLLTTLCNLENLVKKSIDLKNALGCKALDAAKEVSFQKGGILWQGQGAFLQRPKIFACLALVYM